MGDVKRAAWQKLLNTSPIEGVMQSTILKGRKGREEEDACTL